MTPAPRPSFSVRPWQGHSSKLRTTATFRPGSSLGSSLLFRVTNSRSTEQVEVMTKLWILLADHSIRLAKPKRDLHARARARVPPGQSQFFTPLFAKSQSRQGDLPLWFALHAYTACSMRQLPAPIQHFFCSREERSRRCGHPITYDEGAWQSTKKHTRRKGERKENLKWLDSRGIFPVGNVHTQTPCPAHQRKPGLQYMIEKEECIAGVSPA